MEKGPYKECLWGGGDLKDHGTELSGLSWVRKVLPPLASDFLFGKACWRSAALSWVLGSSWGLLLERLTGQDAPTGKGRHEEGPHPCRRGQVDQAAGLRILALGLLGLSVWVLTSHRHCRLSGCFMSRIGSG